MIEMMRSIEILIFLMILIVTIPFVLKTHSLACPQDSSHHDYDIFSGAGRGTRINYQPSFNTVAGVGDNRTYS